MITITSIKHTPTLWPAADNGTSYLNGCIMDAYQTEIKFYVEKKCPEKRLQFKSSDKTISNANNIDSSSFLSYGFRVGEPIKFVHSGGLNQGVFTITAIEARKITVAEAVSDELAKTCDIYLDPATKKVTNLDFYFKLAKAEEALRKIRGNHSPGWVIVTMYNNRTPYELQGDEYDYYHSLTDEGIPQRFIASGLDCADTSTQKKFKPGTDSYAWITDTITNGESTSYIVGDGLDGYKQKFKIIHKHLQAPFFLSEQHQNMVDRLPPSYFKGVAALSYNARIEVKYSSDGEMVDFFDLVDATGKTSWYDQNNARTRPEYYISSIRYTDVATSAVLTKLTAKTAVRVDVTIKSNSALFVSGLETIGTQFAVHHIYCPKSPSAYQQTDKTLLQNYLYDRAAHRAGQAGTTNGVNNRTDYQAIKNLSVSMTNTSTCVVTFDIDYSATTKTLLGTKAADDLNYALVITTQNRALTNAAETDRVAILCDYQNMDYDRRDSTLLTLVDRFHCYTEPDSVTDFANISEYEGKRCFVKLPFRINTTSQVPTIKTATMKIVATKTGKTDFVLEEKVIQCAKYTFNGNVQQLNFLENRGYKLDTSNPFNIISLVSDTTYDSGNNKGYLFHYAFALRDESWINNPTIAGGAQYDILRDIAVKSLRWADYIASGWVLKIRFSCDVEDTSGNITTYQADTDLNVKKNGEIPGTGVQFTQETYFLDENDIRVDSIIKGGSTKIVSVFTPIMTQVTDQVVQASAAATTHYEFTIPNGNIVENSLKLVLDEIFLPGNCVKVANVAALAVGAIVKLKDTGSGTFIGTATITTINGFLVVLDITSGTHVGAEELWNEAETINLTAINTTGNLVGHLSGLGTVNYVTGAVILDFNSAPTFPGNILATYQYNGLAELDFPNAIIGYAYLDRKNNSGGQNKRLYVSTMEDADDAESPFTAPAANGSSTLSWASANVRINIFGGTSMSVETIYKDQSSTFGTDDPCEEDTEVIVIGTSGSIPTPFAETREFEDLTGHQWEDGQPADWQ